MKKRRFVLLDRDGTIIVEKKYLSDPANVELLPKAANGLRRMRSLGLGLVVLTNQSAIGRGLIDIPRLVQIHERMCKLLKEERIVLDGIYFCPHLPEDACDCRKPGLGMLEFAAKELDFTPQDSFLIGDKDCDITLGKKAGATTFLVLTGYGEKTLTEVTQQPDFIVNDLAAAARIMGQLLHSTRRH